MNPTIDDLIAQFKSNQQDRGVTLDTHPPHTLLLCCSDARSDPAIWIKTDLNELFIVRTPGNVIPPFDEQRPCGVIAGITYAIEKLPIKQCIVLNHSNCGGAEYLHSCHEPDTLPQLTSWMRLNGNRDKNPTLDPSQRTLIKAYNNLILYPCIQKRRQLESLAIHALFLDIKQAAIYRYQPERDEFDHL